MRSSLLAILLALIGGCDVAGSNTFGADAGIYAADSAGAEPTDHKQLTANCNVMTLYASEVVSFTPGTNAGYGQSEMPDIVLGPPLPGPSSKGALDVVSLGVGGEIILSFGDKQLVDGPGPDLVIWENVFWVGGNPENPFAELGEVSLSNDGEEWFTFPCEPGLNNEFDVGCAGWRPRVEFDPCTLVPLTPDATGGDAFDLAELGLSEARYVRIRDISESGASPSAGFDLDAVGAIHLK